MSFPSLPGRWLAFATTASTCERCEATATQVIQGETDSFGYETVALCDSCAEQAVAYEREGHRGICGWCHQPGLLKPTRDMDEGDHGPVYDVCEKCRRKQDEAELRLLVEYEAYDAEDFE